MQARQQVEVEFLKAHHSAIGTFRNRYGDPTERFRSSRQSSKEIQVWDTPRPENSSVTTISPSTARRSPNPSLNNDNATVARSSRQANITPSAADAPVSNTSKTRCLMESDTVAQAQTVLSPSVEETLKQNSLSGRAPRRATYSGSHKVQGNESVMSPVNPCSEPLSETTGHRAKRTSGDLAGLVESMKADEEFLGSMKGMSHEASSTPGSLWVQNDTGLFATKNPRDRCYTAEEPSDDRLHDLSFQPRPDSQTQSQRQNQYNRNRWPRPRRLDRKSGKHFIRGKQFVQTPSNEPIKESKEDLPMSSTFHESLNQRALSQVSQPLSTLHDLERNAAKTLTEALNQACPEDHVATESSRRVHLIESFVSDEMNKTSTRGYHPRVTKIETETGRRSAKLTSRISIARTSQSFNHMNLEHTERMLPIDQIGMVNAQSFQVEHPKARISDRAHYTNTTTSLQAAKPAMRGARQRTDSSQEHFMNTGRILGFEEAKALHAKDIASANVPDHIMADILNKQLDNIRAAQQSTTRADERRSTPIRSKGKKGSSATSDSVRKQSQAADNHALPMNGVFFTREDLQEVLPRTRRVIDEHLRSQLLVEHPDIYSIPVLGSQSMPRISLKSLPEYKTLLKQVEDGLPEFMKAIPTPRYAFSKKKKEHMDPVKVGALPSPIPQVLEPLPDPFMALKGGSGFNGVAKEGYAESEFDDGVADNYFMIVGETVDAASRWRWFNKDKISLVGDANGRCLEFEITEYDKNFPDNTVGEEKGLWMEEKIKQVLVSHWVTNQTANMLKCPMLVDTRNKDFLSGKFPVSGLKYNYQEFPPDLAYRPVTLHYGPINWEDIPQPKLNEPAYLDARIFNRTAQLAISKTVVKRQKRRSEEKARARKQAIRAAERELQLIPAPRRLDSAQQDRANNIWVPHLKINARVARFTDIESIRRIYNYYACSTIDAPETVRIASGAVKQRLDLARAENYPFLVAILDIDQGDAPPRKGTLTNFQLQDYGRHMHGQFVVGFARARSFNGADFNCFGDAALLEVFVAPQYCREKIASNLLDRLIACLDGGYKSRQGVRISVEASRPRWNYGWRDTHTQVIKLFYHDIEEPSFVGRKKHLEDHFGFFEVGAFPEICSKDGGQTRYNMSYMMREANRNHRQRPF